MLVPPSSSPRFLDSYSAFEFPAFEVDPYILSYTFRPPLIPLRTPSLPPSLRPLPLPTFLRSVFLPSFHFCRVRPYFPGHLRSPQLCLPFAPPSTNRCCVYIVINPVLRGIWGQNGEAATHQAAGGGHVEALRILLDAAADPGARDMVNDTGA